MNKSQSILNFFVTLRCMPARLKDKLISYILVLCLILDDFAVEMSDLQMDLKMGTQRYRYHTPHSFGGI